MVACGGASHEHRLRRKSPRGQGNLREGIRLAAFSRFAPDDPMPMKTFATMDSEIAQGLIDFLNAKGIAYSTKKSADEAGLEVAEFLAEDEIFDTACSAVEEWDTKRLADLDEHSYRRCPSCNSPHLESDAVNDEETLTKISVIYHCKDCGRVFAPRR